MPRKKQSKPLLNGGDPIEGIPFQDDIDESLDRVIEKLGDGDVSFKVYRLESYGWSFSFEQTGGDLNEEQIREEYGPGRYKVRVFKDDTLQHVQNVNISKKLNVAELPNVNSGVNENTRLMLEMFKTQNENLLRIIEAQGRGRNQEAPTMSEIAETMVKLKQLDGGSQMGPEKVLDLIRQGMDFAKENGSKEPESFGSQLLGAIKEALPLLIAGPGGPQQKQLAGVAPEGEEAVRAREMMLRQGIEFLKKKALAGSDPDLYLGMILDNIDNSLYRSLAEWVMQTDWIGIVAFDPELGKPPHEQFFRAIYDGLRSELGAENSVVSDSGGPGGNLPNAPNDAVVGAGRGKKPTVKSVS